MKVFKEDIECIICGQTSNHEVIMSNYIGKSSDLDFKPNGSMADLGSEILQCPHCGYCNYRLDESVDPRYRHNKQSNLELWKNNHDIATILNSATVSPVVKKYLIMAAIYKQNLIHKQQFDMLIKASWATEDLEQKNNFKQMALDCYLKNILPNIRNELMQVADTFRQTNNFDFAQSFISSIQELLLNEDNQTNQLKLFIEYEKKLIENKDNNIYNLSEIKN